MIGQTIAESGWELARLGKITSSNVSVLFTKDNKITAGVETYLNGRIAEILTGQLRSTENIFALEYGKQNEPFAAAKLKEKFPNMTYYGTDNPEFFPLTKLSGGSPDGTEDSQRLVFEVKCPENPANHVSNLLIKTGDELKKDSKDYWYQIQMNMVCVAKKLGVEYKEMKGVFASYSPSFDEKLQLHTIFVFPVDGFEAELLSAIERGEKYITEAIKLID